MNKIICLILLLTEIFVSNADTKWGYPQERSNGVVDGDEDWDLGECNTGQRQSPVDLNYNAAVKGHFPPLKFTNYDSSIKDAALANTGHSLQINNPKPANILLSGGGLPGIFSFDQMHFHWGSEHTINEIRYGLELHMVHFSQKYKTLSEAAAKKKSIAVLGILFHISHHTNPLIDAIIKSGEIIRDTGVKSEQLKRPIILNDFLPKNATNYFRYEGSLTTPGCGEAVLWTVFRDSLSISSDQLDKLKTLITIENGTLTHNYRPLKPLNSRTLVYVTTEEIDPKDNNSNKINYSLSTIFSLICILILSHFKFLKNL